MSGIETVTEDKANRCQDLDAKGDHPARHRRAEVRRRSSEKNSPVELEILWVV